MAKKKEVPKYEDYSSIIDTELNKRRKRYTLTAINWLNFDDVAQIIRLHIFKKIHLYDSSRPFLQWVNALISNQIRNLIRNNYSNYARPCLSCSFNQGANLCGLFGEQCNRCPLFAKWEKRKKDAYNTKLPVSLDQIETGLPDTHDESLDILKASETIHEKMKKILKGNELILYTYLYIEGKDEDGLAAYMGFKTSESNRPQGYKSVANLKKSVMSKVKKMIYSDEIDIN